MFNILVFSIISGLSTLFGVRLVLKNKQKALSEAHLFNAFAAGIILAIAFLHMLPECHQMIGNKVFIFTLIGFSFFYFLESFLVIHPGPEIHHEEEHEHMIVANKKNRAYLIFYGLFFHSLLDGVIIALGFEHSFQLGLIASLGVVLHELPEGASSFVLFVQHVKENTALKLSYLVAIATPLGAISTALFSPSLTENVIGVLLALGAGAFIYISASDILPETHCGENKKTLTAYFLGFIIMAGLAGL